MSDDKPDRETRPRVETILARCDRSTPGEPHVVSPGETAALCRWVHHVESECESLRERIKALEGALREAVRASITFSAGATGVMATCGYCLQRGKGTDTEVARHAMRHERLCPHAALTPEDTDHE